ncbi:transmembrane protein, putative (macronuclear) [Tetrahymena thermophila SB210]|uniref:Transmembrane protein, putative n=1 Tax=Tetrahymena thermophila (strain SB210) TaxID=312017 RepID=A4VD20_TETTS|nr:transmembrane protein, putative [Tetrahymena thermophila SB210]7TGH_B3 Chain B3, Transmembrane protein, putative [Tetrahymena thermophila]8B6F_B3 Chain B3, Transmembrane protein, putative [Tetrahymena thermophila SB210]8BQS_B3 Chain B3, Transmembrane protein, putative [Tetrahymena thermophila SB210]8GYM_B3 Chain B3, Transmembrane protein, putative [Tetrahymena thermophila SB210]8GYM_b3 Chain b3, Transmembrane protein, putative [Tetrahymena thermophila SB210]8GZU_B3 Chain B3, Transmembrane |eukprot:XP_001470990.1 transmembrane protein, putative [Tetrahymena thermophila SB210]
MNSPQKVAQGAGRKLFKHYINENIKSNNEQKLFFYRVNRWRWNTKDNTTAPKFLRLKYPLLVTGVCLFAYDWTYGFTQVDAHH